MIRKTVALVLFLLLTVSASALLYADGATSEDESEMRYIFDIGSPLRAHYDYSTPRNPWDMVIKDGYLFVASGDYDRNSGRTPLFTYDIAEGRWLPPYETFDEALDTMRVIGDRIIAVGVDSTEDSWEFGNWYEIYGAQVVAHKDLPGAVHCFDVMEYDGRLCFGIGTESSSVHPALFFDGDGYTGIDFIKSGESILSSPNFDYFRVYNFFISQGELYAYLLCANESDDTARYEIYKLEDEAFHFVSGLDGTGLVFHRHEKKRLWHNFMRSGATLEGDALFTTGYLYRSRDFSAIEKIDVAGSVSDIYEQDGRIYILSFIKEESGAYINSISTLGDGGQEILKTFKTEGGYALSLAFDGECFFVGIGSRHDGEDTGRIFRIKK